MMSSKGLFTNLSRKLIEPFPLLSAPVHAPQDGQKVLAHRGRHLDEVSQGDSLLQAAQRVPLGEQLQICLVAQSLVAVIRRKGQRVIPVVLALLRIKQRVDRVVN